MSTKRLTFDCTTDQGNFMRNVTVIAVVASLTFTATTPALAGAATQSRQWLLKQKACKKEASAQGLHFSKKRDFVKECMVRV